MKKKLSKKLRINRETLRYLNLVQGGSAGPTCADTCGEPETGGCYESGPCTASAYPGCYSNIPGCYNTYPCWPPR